MSDTFDFSTSRYDRWLTPDEGPQTAPITPLPKPLSPAAQAGEVKS